MPNGNLKQTIINEAYKLISFNFGKTTADLYEKFYNSKNIEDIKNSLGELLSDLVGRQNAEKQLENFNQLVSSANK